MANGSIPSYLTSATPNPLANRAPWFKNTAQSYAGIFLWIAFFDQLGGTAQGPGVLSMANLGVCLAALVCAGALSVVLFYLVPGLLGMQTGLPLYIVGSSTFGTKGGYFLPGIFMGLLQIGWYSVATYYAAQLVLQGFGRGDLATTPYGAGGEFSIVFVITAVVWGYVFAFLGAKGIDYVARVATFLPLLIIAMLVIGAIIAARSLSSYDRADSSKAAFVAANVLDAAEKAADEAAQKAGKTATEAAAVAADARAKLAEEPADAEQIKTATASLSNDQQTRMAGMTLPGFLLVIQMVIGFFATAGAVGADFCSNNRNTKDVWMGGVVGIGLAILVAGGLALITVAGAHGQMLTGLADGTVTWGPLTDYTYSGALPLASPGLGKIMLLLFAIGSMAPACFCSFIIGNSLSTMLGSAKTRVPLTMGGATIGIILAALGVAGNLELFFGLIGASFGPVIGAMIADYLLSGRRWAGPREGISIPGYAAWVCGFAVGVLNHPWVGVLPGWQITSVYSLIVGFVVYWVLAKAGLEGKVVELPNLKTPEATAA
jgi:cytosine/uracil/thiamine/allantoin permease